MDPITFAAGVALVWLAWKVFKQPETVESANSMANATIHG